MNPHDGLEPRGTIGHGRKAVVWKSSRGPPKVRKGAVRKKRLWANRQTYEEGEKVGTRLEKEEVGNHYPMTQVESSGEISAKARQISGRIVRDCVQERKKADIGKGEKMGSFKRIRRGPLMREGVIEAHSDHIV